MMICTFSLNCDCCGKLISHQSKAIDQELVVPGRPQTFGMDLCPVCLEEAADAVQAVLDPIKAVATAGKRAS